MDCKLKKEIEGKDWYKNTGTKHYLKKVHTQILGSSKVQNIDVRSEVGFVGIKVAKDNEEPHILINSGSKISLFKDMRFLEEIWDAQSKLVMENNAGTKVINQKGLVPGY